MLFRMFNIELEYLPESAKCSEREHFLESNVRHNPLLSLMSRVSVSSLLFPASHITHSHHLKHHRHSGSRCPGPWLGGGRMLYFVNCIFSDSPREPRFLFRQASASQPGHAAAGRQSWILDHDEWMTFLGEQSHSRMITITPSHSVASVWLQSAVNAAYSAAGISNLIYCNVSIVLALVSSSHLLTLHPRGWIFHIVSWTAAISRGRRSYYNF